MCRQPDPLLDAGLIASTPWRPDLHLHTTASDGLLSPREVVLRARAQGVNLMAVTDHDTLHGLEEAALTAREAGISFIPGIEISTQGEEEIHLLGYFVKRGNPGLDALLDAMHTDRAQREPRFLQRLAALGMPITHQDLQIPPGAMFSRPLLARAMVRKGYADSIGHAFEAYLGVGRPGYVPRMYVATEHAVQILREMQAVPVLAHPGLIRKTPEELDQLLDVWTAAGLKGIEAFHPAHTQADCLYWQAAARRRGLLVTGGSDFHGRTDSLHGDIGQMLTQWNDASRDAQIMLDMAA